ncbi:adenosylcobinamide-phosphate synthase [Cohaesibacter sp. ES.047]|uniref:adenosylcobinamide-phosphate synthase CbiB n=1 Tax=Cohaesibacter sp. ES.047 TaxID=1798205 RepID=UPI000BC04F91|nr:adenosylcobinamide-phosphate synthase CbiB [Cohaesibacter sp. ES.047]SNY93285.1 adenosylcobinamide-phosphate synthase [Cohaesibacter sp. ES.047]
MILSGGGLLFAVVIALLVDALFGEPEWVWRKVPHPVVWFGKLIDIWDHCFNDPNKHISSSSRRLSGFVGLALGIVCLGLAAWLIEAVLLMAGWVGYLVIGVAGSVLVAQRSLYDHVQAVQDPLALHDIAGGRQAVSMIVGRDPKKLDEPGIARAAIESLAENFSDGIVAPVFWFCLFGLPGLIIYKFVNTADSMIGHRTERYEAFGWAAARFDDLLNLVPARLTMALLLFAPFRSEASMRSKAVSQLWQGILADAPRHRSPNAGWPEAAMAQRLDIALSGPRYYGDALTDEPFVNPDGKREIGAAEIEASLSLYHSACWIEGGCVAALALFSNLL